MRERRDVITELKDAMQDHMRPGTADSDFNTFDLKVEVTRGLLQMAINEIERLRRTAGETGQSFREIKQSITTQCQGKPQDGV